METMTNMYLKGGKERMKKLKISILLIGIILLIMTMMFSNVYATSNTNEELNFKDQNLQKAFLKMVGKTPDDKLTMGDMEKYFSNRSAISLFPEDSKEIQDLTGIDTIINKFKVTFIYIPESKISSLEPLKNCSSLQWIEIWGGNITDVTPLRNLTNLTRLNISDNNISDLSPLSNLTNLKMLYMYGNNISDISSLKTLVNLEDLLASNNKINDISVIKNFSKLVGLDVSNNNIKDISFISNLKNLNKIFLDNNRITDISCISAENIINSKTLDYWDMDFIVSVNHNFIDFTKPENKKIIDEFKKAGWGIYEKEEDYNSDGYYFAFTSQQELPITANIDIVDANEETQVRAGDNEDLYCLIDVPTGLNYKDCYYRLYFKEYVGKNVNVEGLGTFTYDKKGNTEIVDEEQYIYKCKISNPEVFYKAGIKEYSVTYTVEKTNKTYTTKFKIKVTGLDVKTYEVKADKKIGISLTGAMGNNNLEVNTIEKENKTYVEMVSMLNIDKENMDIYAYDINVEGQYEGELTLTFDVGQEYNGRKANILHIKKDNSTEKFEGIVENGKVTITVNGLSPFMIAIENTNNTKTEKPKEEQKPEEKKEHKLDNTPKTGETFEVTSILLVIALVSLAGIVITNKYKK